MNIGILTFHRALNYGAFLQAFALKEYITSLGHNVEIIDYWPDYHIRAYSTFRWRDIQKAQLKTKIKIFVACILKYRRAKIRTKKMEKLQKKYFCLKKEIAYPTHQSLINLSYDCIFYGSDQIWWKSKINDNSFDFVFWGDYVSHSIKKIAFAASMGVINLSELEKQTIKAKLENFDQISVRERDAQKFLQTISSKNIDIVSDPTFLLDVNIWQSFIPRIKYPQDYILLFNLNRSEITYSVAKKKSNELNLPIIEISSTILPLNFRKNCLQTLDAFEFLGYIKNANFVVTSSFHGTAFSVIFRKQFLTTGMGDNAERALTLLKEFNLDGRYILNENNLPNENIDYAKIISTQSDVINSAVSFIKSSLS